ncbi:MAG: radical SAM protein [Desulfomonilia bacterium]
MKVCELCPRQCRVDRTEHLGACGVDAALKVGAIVIHRGEEPPFNAGAGSGAVFFSGCPLQCSFCQNKQISHHALGTPITPGQLANFLVQFQDAGCSTINLVSPTHYTPQILDALDQARDRRLVLPVMLNSSGYERPDILRQWKDCAQIYLMDLKYGDNHTAKILSRADDYWDRSRETIAYLLESVGPLRVDGEGRAVEGLIVRHLVLPGMRSNPFAVLEFLAGLSLEIPISIMSQYTPAYYDGDIPDMKRAITSEEYRVVLEKADEFGFETMYVQSMDSPSVYTPDFTAERPFSDAERLF